MRPKRPNRREHLEAVKSQLEGLAIMTGHAPHEYLTRIPEKRKPRVPTGNMLERDVNSDIREWARYQPDMMLWRNNRGQVELPSGARITYGVGPNGASDWIGYKSIIVTPDMVGQRIAVFLAVEAKAPRGEPTDDQITFIDRINAAGGRAGIAHNAKQAEEIIA